MPATISIVHPSDDERRTLAECMAREAAPFAAYTSADALFPTLAPGACGCVIAPSDLPDPGTLSLIRTLRARHPALRVVVLGRDADLATAVTFVRAGAVDYLVPPLSARRLQSIVRWTLASPPATRPGAR